MHYLKIQMKKPSWIAAMTVVIFGLLIHMFRLVTVLSNYDDIIVQPSGYGTGIHSGRWLLTIMGNLFEIKHIGYNLAWLNGIISIFIIAAVMSLIISVFDIKSRVLAGIMGALFICFPSYTSLMFFNYTIIYYCIAIAFSVLAAYVVIKAKKYHVLYMIISGLLTACALGIYQAYLPFTISIFVLSLIQEILKHNDNRWEKIVIKGVCYCISLLLGIIFYFVILKICLKINNASLLEYQGISKMGNIGITQFFALSGSAFVDFFLIPLRNLYSITPYYIQRKMYIGLYLISFIIVVFIVVEKRIKGIQLLLLIALGVLFEISADFIVVMCPDANIYTLMLYPFVFSLFFPVVLLDLLSDINGKNEILNKVCNAAIISILCFMILCYSYYDNVNYTKAYYANRTVENYFSGMISQIRMTEGFSADKKWMFVGEINDPLFNNQWDKIPSYGGNCGGECLLTAYSWKGWIVNYMGYRIPYANEKQKENTIHTEQFINMPCWPDYGSIKVIDDVLVVKLSETD